MLQEVGGFLLLPRGKGGLQSGGYRAGAGVRFGGVYPGVREGNGSGTFSRVTADAPLLPAAGWCARWVWSTRGG